MKEILVDRKILKIVGNGSVSFLQKLVTNDISLNKYSHNYLLNGQGRYLFDFFVYTTGNNVLYIDCYDEQVEQLSKYLKKYMLNLALQIDYLADDYSVVYCKSSQVFDDVLFDEQDPRYHMLGRRVAIKRESNVEDKSDNKELYKEDKYNFSIIDGYLDMIQEKSVVIEYGIDRQNSVSYDKGCYIGQEVVSRIRHQGVIRKKIYKITFNSIIKQSNISSDLYDNEGNKIGRICSSWQNMAIAQIREEKFLMLKDSTILHNGNLGQVATTAWQHQ